MKQKHWEVSVFDNTSKTIRNDTLYTTDTEVYLVFELIDEDFTPDSATVTIYNIYGTATISESVDIVNGIVNYEMPVDAIGHSGGWRTQVVFTKDNEDYTTTVIEFDVDGHLLDNNKPTIVYIDNWNSFIKHGENLVDGWEQLEKIRQANERKRESAESVRQKTFETNEAERESTFDINESARQANESARESAESVRVSNEEERISKDSERDGKIEEIEEDVVVRATNAVLNGDFSQGATGWKFGQLSSEMVVSDGVAKVGTRYLSSSPYYSIPIGKNKKYFISSQIKNVDLTSTLTPSYALTNGNSLFNESQYMTSYFDEIDTEKFSRVSRVVTANNNYTSISLIKFTSNSSVSRYAYFDNLIFVNLTDTFGVGNEPTAEQMDALLEQFPNGWFDGTVNIYNSKHMMTMFFKELTKLNNAITTLGGNV